MGKILRSLDGWFSRGANAVALYPLIPAGAAGLIAGYLSTGVAWIAQFGPFGWFTTGLAAFVVSAFALAAISRARLWRVEAKLGEKIAGDSSPFDPMATVYERKRLYLRDLAPLGRKEVIGKKFINCEVIGPGTAIIGLRSSEQVPFPKMQNSQTFDVDCIEIDKDAKSSLAVSFYDCDFEGCRFYHMTLLFGQRDNETLNWITPNFQQARLSYEPDGSDNGEV